MLERLTSKLRQARVGLFSIGHPHYWNQFAGLHDRLVDYGRFIERRAGAWGEVHNFGMVDSPEKGKAAGEFFNVTWPGYVGVLTALAPDRFGASINQAPLRRRTHLRFLRPFDLAWFGRP